MGMLIVAYDPFIAPDQAHDLEIELAPLEAPLLVGGEVGLLEELGLGLVRLLARLAQQPDQPLPEHRRVINKAPVHLVKRIQPRGDQCSECLWDSQRREIALRHVDPVVFHEPAIGDEGSNRLNRVERDPVGPRHYRGHSGRRETWYEAGEQLAHRHAAALKQVDTAEDRGDTDLWMASWDGRENRRLTSGKESESSPRWSPDGRRLAFRNGRNGDWTVWMVAAK